MVTLTEAPQNWEIIQQAAGVARVAVAGTYDGGAADENIIWVGALSEDDLAPVVAWQRAEMQNGTFRATLVLPVGGLYRVEVRSVGNEATPPMSAKQWVARHHIGVGDNYLIAGQSNAAGVGRGYVAESPDLCVHVLRDAREWDLATHPLDTVRDRHNPWLSFAKTLRRALGYPIGLIPTAVSGSQANAEISAPPSVLSGFMPYSVRSARHCASVLPLFKCMGMIRVVAIFPPWKKTQEGACAFSHSAYSVYP